MILVVLGTHHQPFERMLDLVTPLGEREELVIQHGHTPARREPPAARWIPFTAYERLLRLMAEASVVVAHAGAGTIMTALACGKTAVVVPRLRRYGEHVNDHQLEIASVFGERGFVVPCFDGESLEACVEAARRARRAAFDGDGSLRQAVAVAAGARS